MSMDEDLQPLFEQLVLVLRVRGTCENFMPIFMISPLNDQSQNSTFSETPDFKV